MRLLLVEDEHDLGTSIHHALTQRDYIVDWAEDGQTAWDYLNTVPDILHLVKGDSINRK